MSLEYLQQLEELHDQWLLEHPCAVVLDGTREWKAEEVWDLMKPRIRVAEGDEAHVQPMFANPDRMG